MKIDFTILLFLIMNFNNHAIAMIPITHHHVIQQSDTNAIQNNPTTTEYKIRSNKQGHNGFDIFTNLFFILSALSILFGIIVHFLPDNGITSKNKLSSFLYIGGIFYGLLGLLFKGLGNAKRNKNKSQ